MRGIEILKSSPFTTLQDSGRYGYFHMGITNSGAMDLYAYNLGNKLLENSINSSSLEILWGGLKIKSHVNSSFVITGAYFTVKLNDVLIENYQTYEIKVGDILEFFQKKSGFRAYLTFKNGFEVQKVLNSVSTSIKEKIGGLNDGEFIKKGDFLKCENFTYKRKSLSREFQPKYSDSLTLRVIESYQNDLFEEEERKRFYNSTFIITKEFNSMACKLEGESIKSKRSDIISEGIAYGSIQIPKNGKPIILLNERQTIGGYVKFGVVLSIDCYKLSQMKESSKIRFEKIDIEEAKKKLKEFKNYFL